MRGNGNVNPRRARRKGGACKSAWRRVAETYECLSCGAAPYSPCVTTGNQQAQTPHAERTNRAAANLWRPADYEEAEGDPYEP